jgi:hypothetical protein
VSYVLESDERQWLALLLSILEIQCLNLSTETRCPYSYYLWFPQSFRHMNLILVMQSASKNELNNFYAEKVLT